jgi:hypothetical protein
MPQCQNCGKSEKLSACAGCSRSHYCSTACQKQDWVFHREHCISKRQPGERKSTVFEFPEAADVPYDPTPRKATSEQTRESKAFAIVNEALQYYIKRGKEYTEELRNSVIAKVLGNTTFTDADKTTIIARLLKGEKKVTTLAINELPNAESKIIKHVTKTLRLMGFSEDSLTVTPEEQDEANLISIEVMNEYFTNIATLGNPPIIHHSKDYEPIIDGLPLHEKTRRLARNHARRIAEKRFPDLVDDGGKKYVLQNGKIQRINIEEQNIIQKTAREEFVDNSVISYSDLKKKIYSSMSDLIGVNGTRRPAQVIEFDPDETEYSSDEDSDDSRSKIEQEKKARKGAKQMYRDRAQATQAFKTNFPLISVLSEKVCGRAAFLIPTITAILFFAWLASLFGGVNAHNPMQNVNIPRVNADMALKAAAKLQNFNDNVTDVIERRKKMNAVAFSYVNKSEAIHREWITSFQEMDQLQNAWLHIEQSEYAERQGNLRKARTETIRKLFQQEKQQSRIMYLMQNRVNTMIQQEMRTQHVKDLAYWQQFHVTNYYSKFIDEANLTQLMGNYTQSLGVLPPDTPIHMLTMQELKQVDERIKSGSTDLVAADTGKTLQFPIKWQALADEIWTMLADSNKEMTAYGHVMQKSRVEDIDKILLAYDRLVESKAVREKNELIKKYGSVRLSMVNKYLTSDQKTLEEFILKQDPDIYTNIPLTSDLEASKTWTNRFCRLLNQYFARPEFFYHMAWGSPKLTTGIWKWQDINVKEVYQTRVEDLPSKLNSLTKHMESEIYNQESDRLQHNFKLKEGAWETCMNFYWTYYYIIAKEWETRSFVGVGASAAAEFAEFFIEPEFLFSSTALENAIDSWSNFRSVGTLGMVTVQNFLKLQNRVRMGAQIGLFAKEAILSNMKFDYLFSIVDYLGWKGTTALAGGTIMTAQKLLGVNLVKASIKGLRKYATPNNMAKLSMAGMGLMTISQYRNNRPLYWPSTERDQLLAAIKSVGDRRQAIDISLIELEKIFAEKLPHFEPYIASITNAYKFQLQDEMFDAMIAQTIDTEQKDKRRDEVTMSFIEKFMELTTASTVTFTEEDMDTIVNDYRTLSTELKKNMSNPTNDDTSTKKLVNQ